MSQTLDSQSNTNQGLATPSSNDVFISYSRKDKAFVESLDAAFRKMGRDPWVDWDDIRKGEDWWQSIKRGIEAADTFLFVVSPDSVASQVCRDEIEYATQCHKRFLPIVRLEGFDAQQLHPSISRHNWLFFRETDNLKTAFQELLQALDTDLDHVSAHTRLLVRSLEWQKKGHDDSYLLRGSDLKEAGQWLTHGVNKEPRPTQTQIEYVEASLKAQEKAVRSRLKAKGIVVLTTVIANLAFITVGLIWARGRLIDDANHRVTMDMVNTFEVAQEGIDGDEFEQLAQLPLPPYEDVPRDNPLYDDHQMWLETVNRLVPNALLETYIRGENPGEVENIGDVYRETAPDEAYRFREILPVTDLPPGLIAGFEKVIWDFENTHLGEDGDLYFGVYGPIENSDGESVGVLALNYDDEYVEDLYTSVRSSINDIIRIVCIAAAIWFTVSSWLIIRATRPPHELIAAKVKDVKSLARSGRHT